MVWIYYPIFLQIMSKQNQMNNESHPAKYNYFILK